jgi:heme/copper-type cytochrome/quinol oxidase subunit 2
VSREAREHVATSLGWGLVLAVAGYAVVRSWQAMLGHEPDPAQMAWSTHSAFFWRCLIMLYVGGMASFVAWVASRGRLPAAARGLARAVPIAALLVALQALFFP